MIQHINRLMSKCRNRSRRWKKLQKRLQKWYNKRTNKLNDYIEKLTYNLVKNATGVDIRKVAPNMADKAARAVSKAEDVLADGELPPTKDGIKLTLGR